jgi:hypothetical protein
MIRRGRGIIEAATRADVIELFPATACSVWQDALYFSARTFLPYWTKDSHKISYFEISSLASAQ